MEKKEPSVMSTLLSRTPVFGAVFSIANAYAHRGDEQCTIKVASFNQWWNRVIKKACYILAFTLLLVAINTDNFIASNWEPADTILGAFPSILGFGIGVYALMFIMPSDFLTFLKERKAKGNSIIGPEIVPVDMGYPLITFVVIIFIAALNKFFQENYTFKIVSAWALFYGLAMTVELVSFLFISSRMIQKIRSNKKQKNRIFRTGRSKNKP